MKTLARRSSFWSDKVLKSNADVSADCVIDADKIKVSFELNGRFAPHPHFPIQRLYEYLFDGDVIAFYEEDGAYVLMKAYNTYQFIIEE
jgi:hypothetical protein